MRILTEFIESINRSIYINIQIKEKSFWSICYSNALIFDASVSRTATSLQSVDRGANQIAFRIEKLLDEASVHWWELPFLLTSSPRHPRSRIHRQFIGTLNLDAHNVESVENVCRRCSTWTTRAVDASISTLVRAYGSKLQVERLVTTLTTLCASKLNVGAYFEKLANILWVVTFIIAWTFLHLKRNRCDFCFSYCR